MDRRQYGLEGREEEYKQRGDEEEEQEGGRGHEINGFEVSKYKELKGVQTTQLR